MSERGVSLGLTDEQVEKVIAKTIAGPGNVDLLAGIAHPKELNTSPLLDDRRVSRSLLFGLVVLTCFPADERERGVKEVALELDLPTSSAHRYIHTLHTVGLLEQNPVTHRYRRARWYDSAPRGGQ